MRWHKDIDPHAKIHVLPFFWEDVFIYSCFVFTYSFMKISSFYVFMQNVRIVLFIMHIKRRNIYVYIGFIHS